MPKKLSYLFVKYKFEQEGYMLLEDTYINAHSKMKYRCPEGHVHSMTWINWREEHRCPTCAGQTKPSIEVIKSEFEKEGYRLLSKEYINSKTKLYYICSNRHRDSITWNSWCNGHRCPTCYRNNNFGENHPRWKGGISHEPYCEVWTDKEFKSDIKTRDNFVCQNPDCWETSNKLVIHHIDYNKKNCNPNNLITLCNSCNSRANSNRDWHKDWYTTLIIKKERWRHR